MNIYTEVNCHWPSPNSFLFTYLYYYSWEISSIDQKGNSSSYFRIFDDDDDDDNDDDDDDDDDELFLWYGWPTKGV